MWILGITAARIVSKPDNTRRARGEAVPICAGNQQRIADQLRAALHASARIAAMRRKIRESRHCAAARGRHHCGQKRAKPKARKTGAHSRAAPRCATNSALVQFCVPPACAAAAR
ncbi:hypothetical protein NP284_07940, partial [Rhodopseudomonas pseudopalustris]|uniref:hypothetical protein n=1 Tax=Rhodopseudomonas pseudopalustris TaxID=1513892 RepID=UPI003F97458E